MSQSSNRKERRDLERRFARECRRAGDLPVVTDSMVRAFKRVFREECEKGLRVDEAGLAAARFLDEQVAKAREAEVA